MIDNALRWLGLLRCRWFDRHTDILYSVGHNMGKECRFCKRQSALTPEDVAELKKDWPLTLRFPGGEDDEVAVEPSPERGP